MRNKLPISLLFIIPFTIQSLLVFFYLASNDIATYGSNDDALIASFSLDDDLGVDKNNWIFIRSLISIPATFIQSLFPTLGVYGIVLALTIISSTSALYYLVSFLETTFMKVVVVVILTVIIVVFTLPALINPTYTGAAIFAGSSGFALIYFSLFSNKIENNKILVLAFFLTSLSFLIRVESFLLALGFFLSLLMINVIITRNYRLNYNILKIPFFMFTLVLTLNFALDRVNYKNLDWQEYLQINNLRHSIQLRSAEYYLQDKYSQIGWSEEDFTMFRKFSMYDERVLNKHSLEEAIEISKPTRGLTAILNSNPKNELIFINYSYRTNHINVDMDWLLYIIIFLTLTLLVLLNNRSIYLFLNLIPIFLIFMGINYIFAVSYHLPPRLTFNFLFIPTVAIIVLFFIQTSKVTYSNNFHKILTIFMTMLFFIFTLNSFSHYASQRIEINKSQINLFEEQSDDLESLSYLNKHAIFVGTGSRIVYNLQNPYKAYRNISPSDKVLLSGWHNLSPISKKKIISYNLPSQNFHEEILSNPNVFWIDSENAKELLEKYFQQYSTSKVAVEDTGFLGDPFYRIYKISTVN